MKTMLKCVAIVLGLVLLAASGMTIYYCCRFRFPENTTILHTDLSDADAQDADTLLRQSIQDYTLALTVEDQVYTFTAQELSMKLDADAVERLEQLYRDGGTDAGGVTLFSMDITPIQTLLSELPDNAVEPGDCSLYWDTENQCYALEYGTDGEYTDWPQALQTIVDAVNRLDPQVTLTQADYRVFYPSQEKIDAGEQALEQANALLSCSLSYDFYLRNGETVTEIIDSRLISRWLVLGDDLLSVELDEEEILAYASALAETYDIEGEGYFLSHNGEEIDLTVPLPTNQVDSQALSQDIRDAISGGESGQRQVPYSVRSECWNYQGTYVEISIGEQKLRTYIDGKLYVETDIVTGCLHCNHGTKTGVFKIENHGRNIYLQEDKYFVYYWMCFDIPKYGLHDADGWRTPEEYGGDTYKTNGSGGCVNIPREIIADLYEVLQDGTPVIIYDDAMKVSQQEAA